MLRRVFESESQRLQRLAACQRHEADRRASESEAQCVQCHAAGQQREADRRASESEAQREQRLAASQQREADRRASESEAQREQCLAAGQQREADRRASESETQHVQRLAAGQQREADRRASESDAQREHRLSSNRECIATCRANATIEERLELQQLDCISHAARRRSAARQSTFDIQRVAIKNSDRIFTLAHLIPAIVVAVCVTTMVGSYIDGDDPFLLPIHDNKELSDLVQNTGNPIWICSRCKTSLRKYKLPPFALVNNMHSP